MTSFSSRFRHATLLGGAVILCGCTQRTALQQAVHDSDRGSWRTAAPGVLDSLESEACLVEVVPLGEPDEVGFITAYATPRVDACRVRTPRFRHPLHAAPEGGITATRRAIHEEDLLAGAELCWLDDRLEAYLIQVNGSAVVDWVDVDGRRTGAESVLAWSASNDLGYRSLGRMAIDAGLASEDAMSLAVLRELQQSNPDELALLMLENPRYIMFRELPPTETLKGARGRSLVAGVSLAADPMHETDALLLVEPLDGSPPFLGLVHDGGAAIIGAQRLDRYLGSGSSAMREAGAIAMPARVSRVHITSKK